MACLVEGFFDIAFDDSFSGSFGGGDFFQCGFGGFGGDFTGAIDQFDEDENGKGDDEKVDNVLDESTIRYMGLGTSGGWDVERELLETSTTSENTNDGHDNV